jgi:two-component system OmpR family response regulator
MMVEILMIEDDPDFSLFLGEYLARYNMKITNYDDPFLGLSARIEKYDILILDLTLPGIDGLDICAEVSKKYKIPIIISSARCDLTDKVMGLQTGADYYLPKPYDPKEMYAVIQSLLRRSRRQDPPKPPSDFTYDASSHTITFKKTPLNLTQGEYELLLALLQAKGALLSREQLVNSCQSLGDSYGKSLDVMIGRIRQKLGENSKNPRYIHAIRGIGYKLMP